MKKYNLEAMFDSRKSFYGKAKVREYSGLKQLYSYDRLVCSIADGKYYLYDRFPNELRETPFSATTIRHIKEFLRQDGIEAGELPFKIIRANASGIQKIGEWDREVPESVRIDWAFM